MQTGTVIKQGQYIELNGYRLDVHNVATNEKGEEVPLSELPGVFFKLAEIAFGVSVTEGPRSWK